MHLRLDNSTTKQRTKALLANHDINMQTEGTGRKSVRRRSLPTLTRRRMATEDGRRRDRDGDEVLSTAATTFRQCAATTE
uniref:Uncharacterized protein n=1 Tax=Oryza rufipogon TaxID=4529 RepID=A0A0E0Q6T2_ORYRU